MATIYKRGRNWYIDYRYKGRRHQKRLGPSRHLAEKAKIDLEYQIANERLGLFQKEIKLIDLATQFGHQVEVNISEGTRVRYREVLTHFKKFLNAHYPDLLISRLRELHIEHYKGERQKLIKPRTINFEVILIKSMLKYAVKNRYLSESPIAGVKMLSVQQKKPVFLEQGEIDLILDGSPDRLRPVYFAFLQTGMRAGELINLEWSDIDLTKNLLYIRPKDFWQPKTARERIIPITSQLAAVIAGLPRDHRWVFANTQGNRWSRNYLREALVKIAKDQGLDLRIGLHTLRHTFASQLAMKGVSLLAIRDLLGHSTADTTLIYAHLSQSHLAEAMRKLNPES